MKENLLEKEDIQLIDNPNLRSWLKTGVDWSLTTLFWGFLVYLFLPIFSLLLYFLLGYNFLEEVILLSGYKQFFLLLGRIGFFTLVVVTVIISWGMYNYYVFGRRNRRRFAPETNPRELAAFFGIQKDRVQHFQREKFLEIDIEGSHMIRGFNALPL